MEPREFILKINGMITQVNNVEIQTPTISSLDELLKWQRIVQQTYTPDGWRTELDEILFGALDIIEEKIVLCSKILIESHGDMGKRQVQSRLQGTNMWIKVLLP